MQIFEDRFKSIHCTFNTDTLNKDHPLYQTIKETDNVPQIMVKIVRNTPYGNAIIFKNVNLEDVISYNENNDKKAVIQMQSDKVMCLVRNGSSCPELVNGQILAAGVNIIVKKDGEYYCLFTKDKTRPFLTSPGGTATPGETVLEVSKRELFEETTDIETGIDVFDTNIEKLADIQFAGNFFGVPVEDHYTLMKYFYDFDKPDKNHHFFERLFKESNELKFNKNTEISDIFAIKLNMTALPLFKGDKGYLWDFHTFENKHPVTYLHLFLGYVHLSNILCPPKNMNLTKDDEFFPQGLISLKTF